MSKQFEQATEAPPTAGRFANLFVASTCYHVLLASLIARDARFPGESLLVINARREQMAALCEPLAAAADSPFAQTLPLAEVEDRKADRERAYGLWLARLDAQVQAQRVIVFNDITPELQLLCRRAQARGARTVCAEDGGAAYSLSDAAVPWRQHLQRVLRFGPWLQNVSASGSSRYVDVYLARHVDLVRPELKRKAVWRLEGTLSPDLLSSGWIVGFLRHYQLAPAALACDEIYVPARTRTPQARERLRRRLGDDIRAAREAGRDCVVKYHPREPKDFLGAAALGARILPAAIPAELVYLASGARLRRVVGDAGTTLLSARWLVPAAEAFSALELAGRDDPWYARTLDRLGVQRLQ